MRTFCSSVAIGALLAATAALGQNINITGAGATFPYPIYSKWFDAFKQAHPGVQINYQSLGSGAGIRQLEAGTVDFGASDMPMTDEQIGKQKVKPLHFPTVMGGVVPIYNVPGKSDIKFTGAALVGIFNGTIKKWNDPALAKDNPGLPDKPIIVVHRSDGSGTTFVFTDYLTKVNKGWTLGANAAVKWPVGLGAKGSEGVTGQVKNTEYSVSYVELIFATQNNIPYGAVQNKATVDKLLQGKYPDTKDCANTQTTTGTLNGESGIFWVLCFTLASGGQSVEAGAPLFAGANSSGSVYYLVMLLTSQSNLDAFVKEAAPLLQSIQWKLT